MTYETDVMYSEFNSPVAFEEPINNSGILEPGWSRVGSGHSPPPVMTLEKVVEG
jgi:hypothetical protein